MKILLGGIPLGCDNIGDEAIIAAVVKMLKDAIPNAALTVATADADTASILGVDVVPPFGFAGQGLNGFADVAARHDAYIWCGATGLSDYPNVALDLLEAAQSRNVPTFIWGVGMDSELNPVFFRAQGKRRLLLSMLGLRGWYENGLKNRLKKRFSTILPKCKGVWVRDYESAEMLASMGFENAGVAADTAIMLTNGTGKKNIVSHTLGICISAQRQVADMEGVRGFLADMNAAGIKVLGIPMNPKTDLALMQRLGIECIDGTTPDAVMKAAANCGVVLSSRLHLLILAANAGTMGLGISRGSKLDNWLSNFGMKTLGSVYDCDWKSVSAEALSAINDQKDWEDIRAKAYEKLTKRFMTARDELITALLDCY